MMQQPGLTCPPFGPVGGGLGLGLGRRRLWAAQGMQNMPQQVAPIGPMQYSPFPMQAMQQRGPPVSHLLLGAVVMAGLYLLNKSYKVDIQKQPDNTDGIDELLNAKTVKSSTKKAKSD